MNPKPNSVFDGNRVHSKSLLSYLRDIFCIRAQAAHTKLLLRLSLDQDTNKTTPNQGAYQTAKEEDADYNHSSAKGGWTTRVPYQA